MKKQYTIVAACDCGCKTGRVLHVCASSPYHAGKQFNALLDPEWPMTIIAILRGTHYDQLPRKQSRHDKT